MSVLLSGAWVCPVGLGVRTGDLKLAEREEALRVHLVRHPRSCRQVNGDPGELAHMLATPRLELDHFRLSEQADARLLLPAFHWEPDQFAHDPEHDT